MQGYIYLINIEGTDYFKIGKTKDDDIKARLSQLQTANPMKLKVIAVYEQKDYTYAETFIHTQLEDHKIRGEWFMVDFNTMVSAFESYNLMFELDTKFPSDKINNILEIKLDTTDDLISFLLIQNKSPNWIEQHVKGGASFLRKKIKALQNTLK